ncbi:MAG: hypothetical protein H7Y32_06530 [Chloroflexales bacterium]|nr:hypothetical protein [Chloroflexales bacterium]
MKRVLVLMLACALLTACAGDTRLGVGTGSHIQGAVDAAIIHLQNTSTETGYKVALEAIDGDYARARADLRGAKPMYVLMQQQPDASWTVLGSGETIDPALYQQFNVPNDIRLPSQSDRG